MKKLIDRYQITGFKVINGTISAVKYIKLNKGKTDEMYINTYTLELSCLTNIIKETKAAFKYIRANSSKNAKQYLKERLAPEYKNWIDIWCREGEQ